MSRNVRRLGWGLVLASLAASGLSACAASQIGAGAGLSLAVVVTGALLLLGATQTGCSVRPCLSVAPVKDPPPPARPDAGPRAPDRPVHVCLSVDIDPEPAPKPPQPPPVGPCLSIAPRPPRPPAPPAPVPEKGKDQGSHLDSPGDRNEVLAALQDRLPADVKARLGLPGDEDKKG